MKVKELRDRLVSFDNNMEVYASPQIRMELVGENRDIDAPHPNLHYEIKAVRIIGDVDEDTLEVSRRYIVLAFHDPEISGSVERSVGYDKKSSEIHAMVDQNHK